MLLRRNRLHNKTNHQITINPQICPLSVQYLRRTFIPRHYTNSPCLFVMMHVTQNYHFINTLSEHLECGIGSNFNLLFVFDRSWFLCPNIITLTVITLTCDLCLCNNRSVSIVIFVLNLCCLVLVSVWKKFRVSSFKILKPHLTNIITLTPTSLH